MNYEARAIEAARAASEGAYAPYSDFRVGAAVVTRGGDLHAGCNVENASYGLSMCAERGAVFAMVAGTPPEDRRIRLVAIFNPDAAPCLPCGACRQVLYEFGCEEIVALDASGDLVRYPFDSLLPHAFGPEDLA